MEFILHDSFHEEHDNTWAIFSQHYSSPVCLGCIVEILEDSGRLGIQKKPAISELHRLLTYQSGDLLQLFQQEEQVVWHLAEILLQSFKETEDSFVSSAIDTCLKLVQQIGSEDLVMFFFDAIHQQVLNQTNRDALLPHYTLLGKMLYQLPGLSTKLVHNCDQLLHQVSLDLSSPSEAIQSSVAYFFVFLTGELDIRSMSPRLKQQLYHGIIKMLSTVQTQAVQVNGLGLLMNLLHEEEGCNILMSLNIAGTTLVSAIKKLLLSKREALLIGVTKVLSLLLNKQAGNQYGNTILESDLAGVESVLTSLSTAHELKNPQLLKLGYTLLSELLQRQPRDIPLFVSISVVKKCLSLIESGVQHHQTNISWLATKAAAAALRKEHLMLPVPFSELTSILKVVANKTWGQLKEVDTQKIKTKTRNQVGELETRDGQLQIYISLLLNSASLAIQCKCEPAACESTFTAPSSASNNDTVPPLQSYTRTVLQVIDENCIPLMMIHWNAIEKVNIFKQYFELLANVEELDHSISENIINKLVETGFLSAVLEVKDKFRTEATLVEKINKFLSLALECALSDKESGSLSHAVDFDILQDTVKTMSFDLLKFRHAISEGSLSKETVEMYITILYLSYRHDNRPLQGEDLQWVLSAVVESCTTMEQLSPLARKHYIFLLAWSVVKEDMNMRSAIPSGLQTLPTLLNELPESWYTHDIVMLLWCFSDVVLATMSGPFVLKVYLENCTVDELNNSLDLDKPECIQELIGLCSNSNFRQSAVDCLACGTPDLVDKSAILAQHCVCELWAGAISYDEPMDDDDDSAREDADSARSDAESLGKLCTSVTVMLQKVFLGNVPDAKDHNVISLLELLLKIQRMFDSAHMINVKILYHVLNQFGQKKVSEELKNMCLQVIATSLSYSKDNQVAAIVIQNRALLSEVEKNIGEQRDMLPISCHILTSLVSSNIVEAPHKICVHLPTLISHMFDAKTGKSLLVLFEACFQVKLTSPIVKFTGRITPTLYRTLYIFLQQFIVQGVSELMMASVKCLEKLVNYLLDKDYDLVVDLFGQPWNELMLDVLVELSQYGLRKPTISLLSLFLDHDAGIAVITAKKTLTKKLSRCFKKEFYKSEYSEDITLVKPLASKVLEKLNSKLSKSDRVALAAFTK